MIFGRSFQPKIILFYKIPKMPLFEEGKTIKSITLMEHEVLKIPFLNRKAILCSIRSQGNNTKRHSALIFFRNTLYVGGQTRTNKFKSRKIVEIQKITDRLSLNNLSVKSFKQLYLDYSTGGKLYSPSSSIATAALPFFI